MSLRGRMRAWAELLRVSALFTVPGDALAGAAALGLRPNRSTALAVGASLCLYEAGMALNDWADREEDAIDRPHRPIPSGRVSPTAALAAAGALTAAGLALAARAGRPSLVVGTALAATVWSYDLHLKHTAAGPAAMGAARALDLLLGATATAGGVGGAAGPKSAGTGGRSATLSAGDRAWSAQEAPRRAARGLGGGVAASRPPRTAGRPEPHAGGSVPPGSAGGIPGRMSPGTGGRAVVPGPGPAYPPSSVTPRGTAGRTVAPGRGIAPKSPRTGGRSLSAGAGAGAVRAAGPWAGLRTALPSATLLGAHTVAVTTVSRREAQGGSTAAPLAALVATGVLGALAGRSAAGGVPRGGVRDALRRATGAARPTGPAAGPASAGQHAGPALAGALALVYAGTAGRPLLHAALNPSPPLTQRAVGGGIRAMIPLQAALAARGGAAGVALGVMGLVPLARTFARKVSPT
ncbi:UbiA family prenyltransferase [Streptomyces scopuliridis]|uniref:UbiA family prenyltransferase n=1 Tax=Streptomyces scopuliridis TaxID=452529 RepID=UPI0036AF4CAB